MANTVYTCFDGDNDIRFYRMTQAWHANDSLILFGSKVKPNNHAELFAVEHKDYAMPELVNIKRCGSVRF